jgi:hypothetical protein
LLLQLPRLLVAAAAPASASAVGALLPRPAAGTWARLAPAGLRALAACGRSRFAKHDAALPKTCRL